MNETIDRIASLLDSKGLNVFARIDHAEQSLKHGLQLLSTTLIIFGNPKVDTSLMQDKQTIGIDLPAKILAWQDKTGKVWLTYNNMDWLKNRHELSK